MSTLSVLNKYLDKHLSALRETATPDNPIFDQIEHFKSLAELAQPRIKRLDVDGFEIAVVMDTTVMRYDSEKHISNMGELFGSGSYIIRRKEDNQVISGYLRDVARMDTQSRNPFGNHYEISKSQFDAVNESNILGHFLRDKRIASFIQDGVSIDNFADLERMPDYPINTCQFHELHSLRDGEFEVSNEARYVSTHGSGYPTWFKAQAEGDGWHGSAFHVEIASAMVNFQWLVRAGMLDRGDEAEFQEEMAKAIYEDSKNLSQELYFEFMQHGLPETISYEDVVTHKYSSSELNYIRSAPSDPDERSPKFRHQYIDKMRAYYGIEKVHDHLNVSTSLKNAGLVKIDDTLPKEWALHTFPWIKQYGNVVLPRNHKPEFVQERVSSISEGRVLTKEFMADSGVELYSKRSFEDFMLTVSANKIYNLSFKDMVLLTTLPKELFDPKGFTKGETADEQYRFGEMVKTIAPYLITHAEELNNAKVALQKDPSKENKAKVKKLADRYKWLSRGGNNLENYLSTNEKLDGNTLNDFGRILDGYVQTLQNRVAKDLASEPDEVFSVSLGEGRYNIVEVDSSALHHQHLSTIEDDERSHHIKYMAYREISDFVDEYDLSAELVFEGLDEAAANELLDLDGWDMDTVKENVEKHYPDYTHELEMAINNIDSDGAYFDINDQYEEPETLDGEQVLKAIKQGSSDYKAMLEFNKRAHVVQSATQRELAVYGIDDNFGWTPLYDGDYELGEGLTMSVISDKARLIDEAITQQHCVLSYLSKAASGECILLSIADEEGNRVATVELDCDEDLEEFSLMQCYGYRNGKVDPLVEGLVEDFVEILNEEPDELGLDLAEAIEAEIDLDDAEDRPSNYANTLSIVPFETDAAHLSYYILDEMTPDYFSVDEFICNRGWSELFYSSKFGQEINLINRLVAKYDEQGLTPRELIKMNTDGGHGFDEDALEKVLADTYSPKQQFWSQLQEICEQENPSHEPTVESKPDVKPESPSNPKNKGMKM